VEAIGEMEGGERKSRMKIEEEMHREGRGEASRIAGTDFEGV
jgi:hypothetical protein